MRRRPRITSALHAGSAADAATCREMILGSTSVPGPPAPTSGGSFCTSPTMLRKKGRRPWTEHAAHASGQSRRATAEPREEKADHPDTGEQPAHSRQKNAALKHAPLLLRGPAPFLGVKRVNEDEAGDLARDVRARTL